MDSGLPSLPNELRAFLYSCIDSAEQVEILLRLRATVQPTTVRELAMTAQWPSAWLRHHLETLTARGLLRADVGAAEEVRYRYAPKSDDLRRYADLLAEYYGGHRDLVLRSLAARGARAFADAFKLRKDPNET